MDVTDREYERSILFLRTMPYRVQGNAVPGSCISFALILAVFAIAADPPIPPVTVCEILADLPAHEGKDVAVLGRFSFRRDGRWIGEQTCDPATTVPPVLWLTEDSAAGPKPTGSFEFDVAVLNKKFAALTRRTALGKFRFGNPEYDRWAVVYGRVVSRKGDAAQKAPADLVFRGDGVIVFLTTEK
ncbi:MAG: hypothetical protein NTW28_27165 [Candidatus Solibacter sp.]|nr:hypothetical protein [Candidatus Solibacter sp.]